MSHSNGRKICGWRDLSQIFAYSYSGIRYSRTSAYGYFFPSRRTKNPYIDSCLKPLYNGHLFTDSLQRPLSFVPKVAVIEWFNSNRKRTVNTALHKLFIYFNKMPYRVIALDCTSLTQSVDPWLEILSTGADLHQINRHYFLAN